MQTDHSHQRFTFRRQRAFAALAGDRNPMHMDATLARRFMFGGPVVHGVHLVMWALDHYCERRTEPLRLASLKASFPRPLLVGETAGLSLETTGDSVEARIDDGYQEVALVKALLESGGGAPRGSSTSAADASETEVKRRRPLSIPCREPDFAEAASARGVISLHLDTVRAQECFPHLARHLPAVQLAEILATTRLVGMVCPGRNSVFSKLNLTFRPSDFDKSELRYEVVKAAESIFVIVLGVSGPGMQGQLHTFYRPPPQKQVDFTTARQQVASGEFKDQRALIIGGSRGIGEVTGKLICAGGGSVRTTYHRGQAEALNLVNELRRNGCDAGCLRYDVLADSDKWPSLLADGWRPTHVYYYATPFIFGKPRGSFSVERFGQFLDYYILGFARTVEAIRRLISGGLVVVSPSSTAIDDLPAGMGEYATAKSAAETLCQYLQKTLRDTVFHCPRIGRLFTDQTATVVPVKTHDTLQVVLEVLLRGCPFPPAAAAIPANS